MVPAEIPQTSSLVHVLPVHLPTRRSFQRLLLVGDVGEVAATAVLTVKHRGHEDTGTALGTR